MSYRKVIATVIMIASLSLSVSQLLFAQENKSGEINWVQGYISAVGRGTADPSDNKVKDSLNALRSAELIAQRNLLETLKGVQIDSRTTVENLMLKEDIINSRVDGVIKGAQIVRQDVTWEKDIPLATVEIRVCLSNQVGGCNMHSSLMTVLRINPQSEPPYAPSDRVKPITAPLPSAAPKPTKSANKTIIYDINKPVTGAIFLLDGQPFERQLLPVIITKSDKNKPLTVYSVKNVKPKVIRNYGVVRYANNEQQAKSNPYIGDNAVIIPVEDVTEDNMIVISADAVRMIRETTMHGNDYLSDAKVVISSN
jgi:hypothetical protein